MPNIYMHTIFDKHKKPIAVGIKYNDKTRILELSGPITIKQVRANKKTIKDIIMSDNTIVLSDFKDYIKIFDLPIKLEKYNVYDLHLPDIEAKNNEILKTILDKISVVKIKEYQKIISNAAIVYQDLENNGLYLNHVKVNPIWSQRVFSGRSKTIGFNIQGYSDQDYIRPFGYDEDDVLIHFDWICADIRMASILSGDKKLYDSFTESDPYTVMSYNIGKVSRDECKLYLLRSINSMDFTSDAFAVYSTLGDWIGKCYNIIKSGMYIKTILGRRFIPSQAKNNLAVLNGAMQGSVVHAMQLVIRKIWEQFPGQLIADIHDSLVICSKRHMVKDDIRNISKIMLFPFNGVISDKHCFPFKVSIGKKWKGWKPIYTIRSDSDVLEE